MAARPPILYCDDDYFQREALRLVAARLGHPCVILSDAEDAWKLVKRGRKFSLIISDHDMPKMSGEQFLRHVRGNPKTVDTPFVLFTGNDSAGVEHLEKELSVTLINKSSFSFATIIREHLPRT